MKLSLHKIYFIFFGLLDLFALINDLSQNLNDLGNHLSLFTIMSNIFTISLFLYLGLRKDDKKSKINIDSIRGAIIIYMLITGIIYYVFLAATLDANAVQWINIIYHKLMPVVVLLSWFLYPPRYNIKYKNAFYWLLFPLLYLGYTLFRGSITGWYPYSFVNPIEKGYQGVFSFSLLLLIVTFVGSIILILLGNWLQKLKIHIFK